MPGCKSHHIRTQLIQSWPAPAHQRRVASIIIIIACESGRHLCRRDLPTTGDQARSARGRYARRQLGTMGMWWRIFQHTACLWCVRPGSRNITHVVQVLPIRSLRRCPSKAIIVRNAVEHILLCKLGVRQGSVCMVAGGGASRHRRGVAGKAEDVQGEVEEPLQRSSGG